MKYSFLSLVPKENFFPLTHIRNTEDLVCGCFNFHERIKIVLESADFIFSPIGEKNIILFVNHIIPTFDLIQKMSSTQEDIIWYDESGNMVAVSLNETVVSEFDNIQTYKYKLKNEILRAEDIVCKMEYLHEIIEKNPTIVQYDIKYLMFKFAKINNSTQRNTFIHEHAIVGEFVSVNSNHGPVFIDDGAEVQDFSYLEGPLYVGKNAKLYQATVRSSYIGSFCKIGGEVDSSIFMSFSNKAHAGYVGNSYIGSFVNFGAMSTTSNLKNNYSTITLEYLDKKNKTNQIKIGSLIGDFTALGIGTLLTTGTTIGIGCNIVVRNILSKNIKSFSWIVGDNKELVIFEKFIETAKYIMSRRHQVMSEDLLCLLKELYLERKKEK